MNVGGSDEKKLLAKIRKQSWGLKKAFVKM